MVETATLTFTTPSDRELAFTRVFDAPRRLVFDAFTKPELLTRWLHGPPGWKMDVCEIDLRVGGAYHWVWRGDGGKQIGISGVYREIVRPERVVNTESFDPPLRTGEALDTTVFTEEHGKTRMTMTMQFDSREERDMALKSGMEKGLEPSYRNLDELLSSIKDSQ